jgi:aspartate/methionine/tyrosine aminotransferase
LNAKEKPYKSGIKTSNQLSEYLLNKFGVALLPAMGFENDYLEVPLAYVDLQEPKKGNLF